MYKLPHELPNDLITLKLENLNKIPEMFGFDGEHPGGRPNGKF